MCKMVLLLRGNSSAKSSYFIIFDAFVSLNLKQLFFIFEKSTAHEIADTKIVALIISHSDGANLKFCYKEFLPMASSSNS